jgi:hypothetical protein
LKHLQRHFEIRTMFSSKHHDLQKILTYYFLITIYEHNSKK